MNQKHFFSLRVARRFPVPRRLSACFALATATLVALPAPEVQARIPHQADGLAAPADAEQKLAKRKARRGRSDKKAEEGGTADAAVDGADKPLYAKGIGFSVRPLTRKEQQSYRRRGLLVSAVQKNLPAQKSDLRDDDIITSVDGRSVDDVAAFIEQLQDGDEGQTFKLLVVRSNVDTVVNLRLPGESAEEREEREKKEQEEQDKKDEEQRREKEEEEAKERQEELDEEREEAEEEAREKAEEEAEEAEEEAERLRDRQEDLDEAVVEAAEDKFGLVECLVCSFCLPTFTPIWVIIMLLVDNDAPPPQDTHPGEKSVPRRASNDVTVVRY